MVMIQETPHEICVVAEYEDGGKFCLAKFMHEEDAEAWLRSQESKEWVAYRLYKRYGSMEEARWEPLGE
jgi:hypothetical protein